MQREIKITIRSKNYLKKFSFQDSLIKKIAKEQLQKRGLYGEFEIEVVFVGKKRIRSLNKKFRGINSETDVLSFPLSETVKKPFEGILGSVVACPDVAASNIKNENQTLEEEIKFLIAHSIDHLVGIHH